MAATYVTDGIGIPPYAMHLEAFPNPFNSTAMVRFELPVAGDVRAFLFDVSGRQVALINGRSYAAGMHQIPVDGCLLPSGLYHVRLEFGGRIVTRSLVLIR
ncbi:MAG: T9SS type A sorting domain-containing protein [Calditrichaeota bacterium]|nr:T9SS type A sorting domain-containing protein [Calditrichota bacterium]